MDLYDNQARDGVRFVWNSMTATKIEAVKSSIPQAVHYTPFIASQIPIIQYTPLKCSCEALLNSHVLIDFNRKSYTCPFCNVINQLPLNYANHISPTRLPQELSEAYSTYQYNVLNKQQPNGYLFVIDLCINQQQLESIKDQLTNIVSNLPDECYVGVITFHKNVNVYQLPARLNTVYCLNGAKQYQSPQILDILGLQIKNDPRGICREITKKFLVPLGTVRENLIKRIKDILVDPFIYVNQRPQRAYGSALNIAITLVQSSEVVPRVITFLGGPPTIGLGTVIQRSYKSILRTQNQIDKNINMQFYTKASKQYQALAKRCLAKRIIIDIFTFTLEQFGLLEMRKLIQICGGFLVMQEQFKGAVFKDSLKKIFIADNQLPFNIGNDAQIKVFASKQILINGMLGQCYSFQKKSAGLQLSQTQTGQSGTNMWYLGSIDNNKTLSLVFENLAKDKPLSKSYYIQFQTTFKYKGQIKCRVTTVKRDFAQTTKQIVQGFDQQAAAILLARLAVHKCIFQQQKNINSWLDKILFKFTSHFANYTRGDIYSFSIPQQMKQFPQFIYHLRRSQLISTFGVSPDECYYHRHHLLRETVGNSISMIQPALLQYTLQNPIPHPVMLDEESMGDQVILLLDNYFTVVIWQGSTVKDWQDKGYRETQQYEYLNVFFNAPNQDVDYIIRSRFPTPVFYKTSKSHSKQRYLKSRVNPKKGQQNENMLTDDANIKAFTEYLIKIVVTQPVN